MAIDYVHDLQVVFRSILHSMSRPGTISTLEPAEHTLPCYDATFLCVLTLLDTEVTFHVIPEENHEFIAKVSEYTLAKPAAVTEADFIIALSGSLEHELIDAMKNCKIGTLINPEQSATWIVESPLLTNEDELTIQGPGIATEAALKANFPKEFWRARNERTKEYPLGIDLLFTDEAGNIAAVPRTTTVQVREVE